MNLAETEIKPQTWTCPEHGDVYGEGKGYRMEWECPACMSDSDRLRRQLHASHHRYHWWQKYSGIAARYRAVTPAHIKPTSPSAKTLARAVAAYTANLGDRLDSGEGLTLLGPPGLGKTLALSAIINAACIEIHGPVYAAWPDVLAEVKAGFSGGREDPRRQAVDRLCARPLLALDELGVKAASEFDHGELFRLIDHRYRAGLPTLVAANCTQAAFADAVGERIADRLREQGPMIVLTGESQRGLVAIEGCDAFPEPPATIRARIHARGDWTTPHIYAPDQW